MENDNEIRQNTLIGQISRLEIKVKEISKLNTEIVNIREDIERNLVEFDERLMYLEEQVNEINNMYDDEHWVNSSVIDKSREKFFETEGTNNKSNNLNSPKIKLKNLSNKKEQENLKDTIKVEIYNKDNSVKRDYKLTNKTKFDHFIDYLKLELRSKRLLHVIRRQI